MDLKLVRRDRGISLFWMILVAGVAVFVAVAIVLTTIQGEDFAEQAEQPAATVAEEEDEPGTTSFAAGETADAGPGGGGDLPQGGLPGEGAVAPAGESAPEKAPEGAPAEAAQSGQAEPGAAQQSEGAAAPTAGGAAGEAQSGQAEPGAAQRSEGAAEATEATGAGENIPAEGGGAQLPRGGPNAEATEEPLPPALNEVEQEDEIVTDRPEPDAEEQSPTPDDEEIAPAVVPTPSGPEGRDDATIGGDGEETPSSTQ